MSTFQLLIDTLAEGVDLSRLLIKIARIELRDQFTKAGRGSALGAAAALGLLIAILFLLLGVVELIIACGLAAYLAFFITGGALALLSLLLGFAARASFKGVTLRPELMFDQIRRLSAATTNQRHTDELR
jgi:Putative Actinobacterial Holin-X, holin superfamily III